MSGQNPGEKVEDLRSRIQRLDDNSLDLLFREARSFKVWQERGVEDSILKELYEAMKFGPTSMNCNPLRILFIQTSASKEKLLPAVAEGNIPKVQAAPTMAVIAYDAQFFEKLPELFPVADIKGMFSGNAALAEATAFRNGTLQGAYFIIAARSLGLDVNAFSGFNNQKVDEDFFQGTSYKSNFLCALGYGDAPSINPRFPRLSFEEVCQIL